MLLANGNRLGEMPSIGQLGRLIQQRRLSRPELRIAACSACRREIELTVAR